VNGSNPCAAYLARVSAGIAATPWETGVLRTKICASAQAHGVAPRPVDKVAGSRRTPAIAASELERLEQVEVCECTQAQGVGPRPVNEVAGSRLAPDHRSMGSSSDSSKRRCANAAGTRRCSAAGQRGRRIKAYPGHRSMGSRLARTSGGVRMHAGTRCWSAAGQRGRRIKAHPGHRGMGARAARTTERSGAWRGPA
jgi:hypothetical protein